MLTTYIVEKTCTDFYGKYLEKGLEVQYDPETEKVPLPHLRAVKLHANETNSEEPVSPVSAPTLPSGLDARTALTGGRSLGQAAASKYNNRGSKPAPKMDGSKK